MNIDWSKAPEGATHYLPDSREDYECWVKPGYSMRVGTQAIWYSDHTVNTDIRTGKALPRPPAEVQGQDLEQMVKTISALVGSSVYEGDVRLACAAALDAGYRKFEIVEENV